MTEPDGAGRLLPHLPQASPRHCPGEQRAAGGARPACNGQASKTPLAGATGTAARLRFLSKVGLGWGTSSMESFRQPLTYRGGPRGKGRAPAFGECKQHRLAAAAGLRSQRSPGGSGASGTLCREARGALGHGTGLAVVWLCSAWLGTAPFKQGQVYLGQGMTPQVSGLGNVPPWCHALISPCSRPSASP